MLITLYKTSDSNNTINKTLIEPVEYNIVFKEVANITNPTIKLKADVEIIGFNYCYIHDFKRYYFISDITIAQNNIYVLSLRCDVLESFKDEILSCQGVIVKSTTGNQYLNGGDYESEVRKETDIYYSDVTLIPKYNIITTVFVRSE